MQNDKIVDKFGGPGTPLQCALRSTCLYGRYDGLSSTITDESSCRAPARNEIIQMLLNGGAKVDCSPGRDFDHDSPLEITIRLCDRSLTRLLLNAGAKVSKYLLEMMEEECRTNPEWKGYLNDIVFENLCDESRPLYTKLALSSKDSDQTLLHDMLEDPVEAFVSKNIADELGPTLRKAARLGQIATLNKLLSCGGLQVDAADDLDGSTALHHAAEVGQVEAIKLLLKYGSDINKADNKTITAVYHATWKLSNS
jgi:ankyrin repeat protein